MATPIDEAAFGKIEEKIADVYAIYNSTFPEDADGEHMLLDWVAMVRELNVAVMMARSTQVSVARLRLRGGTANVPLGEKMVSILRPSDHQDGECVECSLGEGCAESK